MRPIGLDAADQRAWNSTARSPSRSSIWALQRAARPASLSARSASGDEARKVELGVGSAAEADGVRAAACAPPRRQGGDARLNIKVDAPLWARARGQGMEPGPPPVASHLPWAGLTLTPKLRGSCGLHRGRCRLVNRATSRVDQSLSAAVLSRDVADRSVAGRSKGRSSMGNRNLGWPVVAVALSALALSACSTTPSPQVGASAPPEPEIPAHVRPTEIVGRWGYAAYHKPEDRTRTEANARGQCKQPYVIDQGANGGVMMYLADSSELQELRLKGSSSGKDYIGPAGRTPGVQDREILSFDGRVMILKYVDPEVDGRYGTGIFVRCAPRAAQANAATSR